jgi:hypothetical protein
MFLKTKKIQHINQSSQVKIPGGKYYQPRADDTDNQNKIKHNTSTLKGLIQTSKKNKPISWHMPLSHPHWSTANNT